MRSTDYADELTDPAKVDFPDGGEGRLELLRFKQGTVAGDEGYRFSWWMDGRIMMRPMDCTEEQFLTLIRDAVTKGIFSAEMKQKIVDILS